MLFRSEKRLLFLALLNSSGIIEWRSQAAPEDKTILQHFEYLAKTVSWLEMYSYDYKLSKRVGPAFPKFVISPETKKLDNLKYWLQSWENARVEYETGSKRESLNQRILRRERALTKLINNSAKEPEQFAWLLAQWAADSTDFPETVQVRTRKTVDDSIQTLSLRDYWISILVNKNEYETDRTELEKLELFLVDNLDHGSVYAFNVLKLVRSKMEKQQSGLGLREIFTAEELQKINDSPFTIVTDTIEQENVLSIVSTAPSKEPARVNYVSNLEYLKDRAKWNLAQSMKLDQKGTGE